MVTASFDDAGADTDGILEGDCLHHLGVLARAGQRFDLIYVDPPFNAGGERKARLSAGEQRASGTPAYRDQFGGIDAFLDMLEPRLEAMRNCLSGDGSLWLHLGHQAVHEAKILADRVFGRAAFQGEVIWVPGNGGRRRGGPSVTHQTILIYCRSAKMIWNGDAPTLREPYADTSLRMHFKSVDEAGRRFRERVIGGKAYRYYAAQGRRIGSVWTDCPAMKANTPLTSETTGYPTQKPEALLERIVLAATHPHSRVLDPMCGSGTTAAVARRLGRRVIGIDQSPVACNIARARLAAVSSGPEPDDSRGPQLDSGASPY
jgi:site-specific DNA-methyltransferase (adenine-specific)